MNPPRLLIFDDGKGVFGPMTHRRAAFGLRTGALSNRVRIERRLGATAGDLHLPARLAAVQRARETAARVNAPLEPSQSPVLVVNGRWTGVERVDAVRGLPVGHALLQSDGQLLAAHLPVRDAQAYLASGVGQPPRNVASTTLDTTLLLDRPWHILDQLEATLACDLAMVDRPIDPTATVHPTAVLDDAAGPVVVAEHAVVGALSMIEGPCYIGPHSVVVPRAYIRRHSVIGPQCKVAGEISASIIHGSSNKSHEGYLGNSLVGEWVNLGANTNVSNLKNTYGEVTVQLDADADAQRTGRAFVGPIIGDFVRTAIGTRLTTGSVIGTAAMIATSAFAPKFVPPFTFLTDKGAAPTDIDKFLDTARAMLARRKLRLAPTDEQLLRELARG